MGFSQSVPMEPDQAPVMSMASPELVDADKVSVPQDSSQGSQYSVQWEADRDALSRRIGAMAEAGILEPGAFKQFLQKTVLPDRNNSENLSQVRFDVEQLTFNAKLQSWVDSRTPIVSQSESHDLEDAQRLPVSESGSEGTGWGYRGWNDLWGDTSISRSWQFSVFNRIPVRTISTRSVGECWQRPGDCSATWRQKQHHGCLTRPTDFRGRRGHHGNRNCGSISQCLRCCYGS